MTDSKLLQNAVVSIQLGVEDFQSNDPRRPISAARNFFAGILLLSKEALVVAAGGTDPDLILAAKVKPVSDGKGGVKFESVSNQTVDFNTLGERLYDFDIRVDQVALKALNKIRNDIEHRYTTQTAAAVRQAIAKAFPVVLDLCRYLGTTPSSLLGDAWSVMIGVRHVYDVELAKCRASFSTVRWQSKAMDGAELVCTACNSELVMQDDPDNTDHEAITSTCQSCGKEADGDALVAKYANETWALSHADIMDGAYSTAVHHCPSCAVEAYLTADRFTECAWCGHEMGECLICENTLSPENVSFEDERMCCDCEHRISKE